MCWHMCNSCNEKVDPDRDHTKDTPCLWHIIGVDESGLSGCPYFIHGENNEDIDPASWVAITDEEAQRFLSRPEYHDDTCLNEEEHSYNQNYINSYLDGE